MPYTLWGLLGLHLAGGNFLPRLVQFDPVHALLSMFSIYISGALSLHSSPSLTFCFSNSSHLSPLNFDLCLLNSVRPPCSTRGSPSQCQHPGSTSRQKAKVTAELTSFISFLSGVTVLCCLVHCLKTVVYDTFLVF